MRKFILYFLKITVVGILLASIMAEGSYWALRNGNFYKPSFVQNLIKEKELDYVVLGASTALTGIDTQLLDSLSGMKGYNLAIDDTGLPNAYLMLRHFLAQNKTTKNVILVPTIASLNEKKPTLGDNDYRFLMYNKEEYVHNYYKKLEADAEKFPVMSTTKYAPFLGISYYNVELFFPSLVSWANPKKSNRFDKFGNYTYPHRKFKPKHEDVQMEKVDFSNLYFKKIAQLCQRNNIQLSVYFPPIYNTHLTVENNTYRVINFTDKLNSTTDFYDVQHVNQTGRRKVTMALAQILND